ncbi:DUF4136 domain-containing protein [Aurantiacibacter marinus]|uniref:DUF4136 domain-containing protein n=1 Tax=Aurantiacibacter marinus TaxID=874156 RepID=A0A0H0XRA5_9SPHN|nr:DUF4136 domain-containing protein [Aurantiacibacter marinus]KLI64477.1 hypothetical protein AAV99_02465 [Aurantiacibacter marinus]
MKQQAIILLAACALATGCATPAYVSPVEVTRFVGDTPTFLAQGTIEIVAGPAMDGDSLEFGVYREAIRQELEALGYRVVASNGGQIAMLDLEAYATEGEDRRGGVGVGAGGSTGRYGSGVGVGVGINLNSLLSGPPAERIERQIFVAIRSPEGGANLWEGRASMTATSNSDYGSEAAAASRMADALFTGFPGNSGETIEVE